MSSYTSGSGAGSDRLPGARRQKVLGYLKAANDLRQTYTAQWRADGEGMPGAYPDADVFRSGDEEMVLFPSYARRHTKRSPPVQYPRDLSNEQTAPRADTPGDADYWRRQWEIQEDANAVVDVDVRGWIYVPQTGPMTRRNRLLVAVARKLSGIPPLDASPGGSREASVAPSSRFRTSEDQAAWEEASRLSRHGQREADAAADGRYSAQDRHGAHGPSRSNSPTRLSADGLGRTPSRTSSWGLTPETMSRQEAERANEQLMTRLQPFMAMPMANNPVTVFFFNHKQSSSKTVTTDESGHFNLRAALDFVPMQVRVLASEKLSVVEDVVVTESQGISLISDIDDTIKHSAIASGAKEIFRNTFIRELDELTIQGVQDWYSRMAQLGVQLHYVSNSPWQLYPLLKTYFSMAGLPAGSIHLKQYSGMLQGIFEPAAERKRGSLERIMNDFPDRRFILVGDSGEADLEVYTDVVLANPGRVLGVFIRDVTTAENKHGVRQVLDNIKHSPRDEGEGMVNSSPSSSHTRHDVDARPPLPSRPQSDPWTAQVDLVDLGDDFEPRQPRRSQTSYLDDMKQLSVNGNHEPNGPPRKPVKPPSLRGISTSAQQIPAPPATLGGNEDKKRVPPPPPRPRRAPRMAEAAGEAGPQTPGLRSSGPAQQAPVAPSRPPRPTAGSPPLSMSAQSSRYSHRDDDGYAAMARRQINSAYNALPALRAASPTVDAFASSPSRRGLTSLPAAAARWATGATDGDPAAGGDGGAPGAPYNKREEIWKRRWLRAEDIMRRNGVVLKTWRIGSDIMDECVRLVGTASSR